MRKKIAALSAGVLLGAMLSGCGMNNQGDLGNKNIRPNSARYDANGNLVKDKRFANHQMYGMKGNNSIKNNQTHRMEMSEQIADRITKLGTVKSSYVMLTNNNAYVAVSFNDRGLDGNAKMMNRTNMGLLGRDGAAAGKRMGSLSTSEDKLTDEIKNQVADAVKQMDPGIANVYVSANPDFVGRMNAYMNDVKLGHPISGFFAEFSAMVERLFPAESGTNVSNGNEVLNGTGVPNGTGGTGAYNTGKRRLID